MTTRTHLHPSDLHGLSRLAVEGVRGTSALVEQLHQAIARVSGPTLPSRDGRTRGITGLVYRSIHGVTGLVGGTLDIAFRQLVPRLPTARSTPQRDRALAALNGVLGDHLETSGNPLALPMSLRFDGQSLTGDSAQSFRMLPRSERKIAVFIHGLCMSDHPWAAAEANRDQIDLPRLIQDRVGYLPLQLFYNSGRSIGRNGRDFAELLESLVQQHQGPVNELVLIGHSMGGLVARSAILHAQLAGHGWRDRVTRLITLGTPHHGAPLERIGNQVDRALALTPFSRPFTRLGRIRSAGITDLRYGQLFEQGHQPCPAPGLPTRLRSYAVAASLAGQANGLRSSTIGDGLVTVDSALGRRLPAGQRPVGRKIVTGCGHLRLLNHPEVANQLVDWLQDE